MIDATTSSVPGRELVALWRGDVRSRSRTREGVASII
jgi:hypothetical protein